MRRYDRFDRFLFSDIFRQLEQYSARPFFLRQTETFANERGNAIAVHDLGRSLAERRKQGNDVDNLELGLFRCLDRFLPSNNDERKGPERGIGRRCGQVRGTRPERCQAHTCLAGQAAIGRRHEASALFVTGQNQRDGGSSQRFQEIQVLFAWNGENIFDALGLERGDHKIGSFHSLVLILRVAGRFMSCAAKQLTHSDRPDRRACQWSRSWS